jgi:heme/copper-type cytochrome/quinol oxidase subunit 3|tara:strand:- start:13767 stop:14267 length:501 start_codon:yes stop_codon:yes gene_type:complete
MMMAGALGLYMARRHASGPHPGHDWLNGLAVPNPQMVYALLTLVASMVTAHWALWASRRRDNAHAWTAIATTIVLGLGFINMVMYSLNRMGLEIGAGEYQNLAFATTGLALAIVVVGLVYLGLMGLRSLGGSVGQQGSTALGAAVFFWDFAALAWAATWYTVYVVK